jgi:acyl-CoA reductase-like NAD-dependent aldehyde dehydrogenase
MPTYSIVSTRREPAVELSGRDEHGLADADRLQRCERTAPVRVGVEYGLFVDGRFVEPQFGEVRELDEPATDRFLARAAMAAAADVDGAVVAGRAALDGAWGRTPPNERARLLQALADAIDANRLELAELEARNVGKAIMSANAEVGGAIETFRFFASIVGSISGRSNSVGSRLLMYTLKEPVGVCGQIVPWNFPLMTAAWKLAPALAAGCTVVLKPDPQTPLTTLRLAELAGEVGFPAGAINVVPGDGPTIGAYLVTHPGVDKVAFTGSTRTGIEIMRLCSDPIKRLTLELGGKSPNLVFADADLDDAIPNSVWAIYNSAGQSCLARSRMLVEASIYDEFVTRFADATQQLKVGDPLDPETRIGSLISVAHRDDVHQSVERAREDGAEVVTGGEFGPGAGAFYVPTVLAAVDNAMTVAQEEIYGPVVAVIPFEDEADAIRISNDVRYGLFATVWTGDPARGHRVASAMKSGMVGINTPYTAFPGIPFGGYKQSGFGRELSIETLDDYLETKGVLVSTSPKVSNPYL